MPNWCVVPGCRSNYWRIKSSRSLFSFPKDPDKADSWRRCIPNNNVSFPKTLKVCDLHFEERFLLRNYEHFVNGEVVIIPRGIPALTADAIPTIFPDSPSNRAGVYCSVPLCKSKTGGTPGLSFHLLPNNSKRELWIRNIKRQGEKCGISWMPRKSYKVCSKHFTEECFSICTKTKTLLAFAVPTVFEDQLLEPEKGSPSDFTENLVKTGIKVEPGVKIEPGIKVESSEIDNEKISWHTTTTKPVFHGTTAECILPSDTSYSNPPAEDPTFQVIAISNESQVPPGIQTIEVSLLPENVSSLSPDESEKQSRLQDEQSLFQVVPISDGYPVPSDVQAIDVFILPDKIDKKEFRLINEDCPDSEYLQENVFVSRGKLKRSSSDIADTNFNLVEAESNYSQNEKIRRTATQNTSRPGEASDMSSTSPQPEQLFEMVVVSDESEVPTTFQTVEISILPEENNNEMSQDESHVRPLGDETEETLVSSSLNSHPSATDFYNESLLGSLPRGWFAQCEGTDLLLMRIQKEVIVMTLRLDCDLKLTLKLCGDSLNKDHPLHATLSSHEISTVDDLISLLVILNRWKTCLGLQEKELVNVFLHVTQGKDCRIKWQTMSLYSNDCQQAVFTYGTKMLCDDCQELKNRLYESQKERKRNCLKSVNNNSMKTKNR